MSPDETQQESIKPAVRPVCEECGAAGGYIKRRPHSTAEIGRPNNPMLCLACAREVSR